MDARLYWIWMQQALTLGSSKADTLLRGLGSARAVYEAPARELSYFGLSEVETHRLSDKSLETAHMVFARALEEGGWVLTPEDRLYPSLLRAIPSIPLVLYGRGEMPDLDILPSVAIVGTREASSYGRRATALLAGGLALGGAVIVSGGARGVDTIAHEAALAAGGQTVAVQGCGLDIAYPPQNTELRRKIAISGAVVSEFPPGTPPLRHHFPLRNRLISGMTLGTCVTEAPEQSGALITASRAFEQGRDVFAVAGDMLTGRSPGTDELIRQGARLVTGAIEILEEYRPRFPDIINSKAADGVRNDPRFRTASLDFLADSAQELCLPDLPTEESSPVETVCPDGVSQHARAVLALLDSAPRTLGELIGTSGLTPPQVMTALTELELGGVVRRAPGQVYIRC